MRLGKPKAQLIEQNESLTVLKNRMIQREGKSENTLRRYLDGVKLFTEYMQAESPDAALKAFAASEDRTGKLDGFIDYLIAEGVKAGALKSLWFGVRKWLIANRVNGIDYEYISKPKSSAQVSDRIPTTEELQVILNNKVSLRDKAVFLTAASSGLRFGTLITLQVKDYEPVEELGKITVNGGFGRKLAEGKSYFTFVTPETRGVIEQYLSTRKDVKPSDPLFAKDSESDEPYSHYVQSISRQWRRLVKRANLFNKIPGHKWIEIHGHTLRKYFQTHAKLNGCRSDFVDFWLGHHPARANEYLNDSYFRPDLKAHLAEYRKAVGSLSVFSGELEALGKAKEDIEALQRENALLKAKVDRIEASKESLAALLNKVLALEKRLDEENRH